MILRSAISETTLCASDLLISIQLPSNWIQEWAFDSFYWGYVFIIWWWQGQQKLRAFQWSSSLSLHIKQNQARTLLHLIHWPHPQILLKTQLFLLDARCLYTVFYYFPNIHFGSALYFFSQIMDRYLSCMDCQLFVRKADCYCTHVQSKSQPGLVLPFSTVITITNRNKIPHFASRPVWLLHLPLPLLEALERFIVNFSIETGELQHSWNLNITHRIIHFI